MKGNKTQIFKRLIAFSMSLAIIGSTHSTAFASSPELDDQTLIVSDQEGNITYETADEYAVPYENTARAITDGGLIITPGYDDSSGESGNSISPLANVTLQLPVTSTVFDPYKTICRVESTFPNGTTLVSTGVLVHYNILLTSAHGIYQESRGGYANTVVYPGSYAGVNNQPVYPFGSASVTTRRIPSGYINGQKAEYDWALLDLNRRFDSFHAFGYAPNYSALTGRTVSAYGYPNGVTQMYYITGPIRESFEKLLHISIETHEGQSGGPVVDSSTGAVIGIVKGHEYSLLDDYLYNVSVRIDEYLYNVINQLKEQMQ